MSVKKNPGKEGVTEGVFWALWWISETLKKLMDSIMKPINKILEDFWFKEKKEKDDVIAWSKEELENLMQNIKTNVDDNTELNEKEKIILEWLFLNNENLKTTTDRIKKEFWEDIAERESAIFLSMLKIETDGWEIEESELNNLVDKMKKNKEKIEWDENLKWIIKIFPSIKHIKKGSSIGVIITAYDKIKNEKEKNNDDSEITSTDVLAKIN